MSSELFLSFYRVWSERLELPNLKNSKLLRFLFSIYIEFICNKYILPKNIIPRISKYNIVMDNSSFYWYNFLVYNYKSSFN